MAGSSELVSELLCHGAELLCNDRGESCEQLARANGHLHVLHHFETFAL